MSDYSIDIDVQEQLSRLTRSAAAVNQGEQNRVTRTGAAPPAWVVKVESLVEYNIYQIQQVSLSAPGASPAPITGGIQAVNIAESFTSPGTISTGTYAVMWRVGDKNVFYVKP